MPTSLENLPRELRQHIFALAFDDAAAQDHRLNELIRTCIRRQDGMMRLEYNFIPTWQAILGRKCSEWANMHASHIHQLATTLSTTYPDLTDDVAYVLERSLKEFEGEQVEAMSAIEEIIHKTEEEEIEASDGPEGHEAIEELCRRARARGERHDNAKEGNIVLELNTIELEDDWQLCGWRCVSNSAWQTFIILNHQTVAWKFEAEFEA